MENITTTNSNYAMLKFTINTESSAWKNITQIKDDEGNVLGTKNATVDDFLRMLNRTDAMSDRSFKVVKVHMKDGSIRCMLKYVECDGEESNELYELESETDIQGVIDFLCTEKLMWLLGKFIYNCEVFKLVKA